MSRLSQAGGTTCGDFFGELFGVVCCLSFTGACARGSSLTSGVLARNRAARCSGRTAAVVGFFAYALVPVLRFRRRLHGAIGTQVFSASSSILRTYSRGEASRETIPPTGLLVCHQGSNRCLLFIRACPCRPREHPPMPGCAFFPTEVELLRAEEMRFVPWTPHPPPQSDRFNGAQSDLVRLPALLMHADLQTHESCSRLPHPKKRFDFVVVRWFCARSDRRISPPEKKAATLAFGLVLVRVVVAYLPT